MEGSITAWATVVLAILTAVYVCLTYRLLRAQSDPCVIVYVQPNSVWPLLLEIVVENVGRGLAKDIRFELSEPVINCQADSPSQGKPFDSGPLIDGIPALQPGGKRLILWGNYPDIQSFVGDKRIEVVCRFERADDLLSTESQTQECVLEYRSFGGTHGWSIDRAIADKLDKIAKVIEAQKTIQQVTRNPN